MLKALHGAAVCLSPASPHLRTSPRRPVSTRFHFTHALCPTGPDGNECIATSKCIALRDWLAAFARNPPWHAVLPSPAALASVWPSPGSYVGIMAAVGGQSSLVDPKMSCPVLDHADKRMFCALLLAKPPSHAPSWRYSSSAYNPTCPTMLTRGRCVSAPASRFPTLPQTSAHHGREA